MARLDLSGPARTPQSEDSVVAVDAAAARLTLAWLTSGGVLLFGLALVGLILRISQSVPDLLAPPVFFALLTLHGVGMAGLALAVAAAVYWHVARRWLPLSIRAMWATFALTLLGTGLLIVAAIGGYGAGWTMLYPLPGRPGPAFGWPAWAAAAGILGFGTIVLAAALWSLDLLRAGVQRYGGLGRLLGLDILEGSAQPGREVTNPTVIAGTVVAIDVLTAIPPGALGLLLLLGGLVSPAFSANALLAKNLTFFAGHVMVNVPVYLGAGLTYALLPTYTGRPWPATRPVVLGWLVTVALVMLAAFHHFYQDFAEPLAADLLGQVASYASGIPPLVVTIFGALLLVYRSGLRWSATPLFLYAGLAAWAIGGYAAVLDSTPWLNQYLHNTLWVPGYFHVLMALSVLSFVLGGLYHVMPELSRPLRDRLGRRAAVLLLIGGAGLTVTWFTSGVLGQPRRYPMYLPQLTALTWVGTAWALLAIAGAGLIFADLMRAAAGRASGRAEQQATAPAYLRASRGRRWLPQWASSPRR